MTVKGNIVNCLFDQEPFEKLLGKYLDKEIRNSIDHYNYDGEEVVNIYGQTIRFVNLKNSSKSVEKSQKEICYYIWQMYKGLSVIYELN